MPIVAKQKVPFKPAAVVFKPEGGGGLVLDDAVDLGSIEDFLRLCVWGKNRVGKTSLVVGRKPVAGAEWGGLPKPMLLVTCEPCRSGGTKSVKSAPGVKVVQVVLKGQKDFRGIVQEDHPSERVMRLGQELAATEAGCPYKSVVIDTVTSFQEQVLAEVCGFDDVLAQNAYGAINKTKYQERALKVKESLRAFMRTHSHTAFLAQEKDHNPQRDEVDMRPKIVRSLHLESFFGPAIGGSALDWMNDACDIIHMFLDAEYKTTTKEKLIVAGPRKGQKDKVTETVATGRQIRRARLILGTNYAAGLRTENPNTPEFLDEPTIAKIEAVIRG